MLKSEILAQFENVVRSNLSADFEIIDFDEGNVSLLYQRSDARLDLELSDARIRVRFNLLKAQFISEHLLQNIIRLSSYINAEAVLFSGDQSVDKLDKADQLYIYSDYIDIRDSGDLTTAFIDLINIISLTASAGEFGLSGDYFKEGSEYFLISKKLERSQSARKRAVELHGLNCCVCDFNFEVVYGDTGKGYIHIHHLIPVSVAGYNEINPETDLVPVCPNCHAIIHTQSPPISIQKMKELLKK